MKDTLQERIEDLRYAIRQTETCLRNCDTPTLQNLYKDSLKYYFKELEKSIEDLSKLESL